VHPCNPCRFGQGQDRRGWGPDLAGGGQVQEGLPGAAGSEPVGDILPGPDGVQEIGDGPDAPELVQDDLGVTDARFVLVG